MKSNFFRNIFSLLLLVLIFFSPAIFAAEKDAPAAEKAKAKILSEDSKVFDNRDNPDCKKYNTCSLSWIKFQTIQYQIGIKDHFNYGTRMNAWYATTSVKNLEDYVFVQFVRGCQYRFSTDDPKPNFSITRTFFGKQVIWRFPEWQVDSEDTDPVYNSAEDITDKSGKPLRRHDLYRWNETPWSSDKDSEHLYVDKKPEVPLLYVSDLPGQAYLWKGRQAINISIEFLTCLYSSKDVPKKLKPSNINFAEPIVCYQWQSHWAYDQVAKEYNQDTATCSDKFESNN